MTESIGEWLTESKIIDTLLRHACAEATMTQSGSEPIQTEDDLSFWIEELNHPAPDADTSLLRSKLSTAMRLRERTKKWKRLLSGAIAKAEAGEQPEVLLAKNMRTPLDHPEFDDWRFHIESVYEWAKSATGIDVPEWREALTDHTDNGSAATSASESRSVNELAIPALAALIRMFLLEKEATWVPGEKPSGEARDYFHGRGLHQQALATAALNEVPQDTAGKDRARVSTTYLRKAQGLVVATDERAPALSDNELPGAYRLIYGLALAVVRHFKPKYNPDSGNPWPPGPLLDRADESGLVSRDELEKLLRQARAKRLNP